MTPYKWIATIVLVAAWSVSALAQTDQGKVRGTVRDQSNAFVAGAKVTATNERTGQERTSPMMYVPSGDRLLVIASNNGAPEDPHWYQNLVADPAVTVELPGDTYPARAEALSGDDYEREWAAIKESFPFFAEHETRAGRRIPVVALTRTT